MSKLMLPLLGYLRGNSLARAQQKALLQKSGCTRFLEDDDDGFALAPALQQAQNLSQTPVTLIMTNLENLGGSLGVQLEWLRKWFSDGNHVYTLDSELDSLHFSETTTLIAILAGHNPDATPAPAGRPSGLSAEALKLAERAEALYHEKKLNAKQCARRLGIARSTYYRYLKHRGIQLGTAKKPSDVK